MTPREEARTAVAIVYAVQVTGMPQIGKEFRYSGEFDVLDFVKRQRSPANPDDHHRAWNEMWNAFDREWPEQPRASTYTHR